MEDLDKFRATCCKEGALKIHARYLRRVIREAPSSLREDNKTPASLPRYLHFIVLFALMCQLVFFYTWPVLPDRTITPLPDDPSLEPQTKPTVTRAEQDPPPIVTSLQEDKVYETTPLSRRRPFPPFRPLETSSKLQEAVLKLTHQKTPILISMVPYARTGWGTFSISLIQETLRSTQFYPIIKPEGCTYVLNRNQVPSDVIELHEAQKSVRDVLCAPGWETRYLQVPFAVVCSF